MPTSRRERYSAYLHSEHWRALKVRCFRLRGHRCEVCHSRHRIEGHHLTYREPLESCTEDDVMILCHRCHATAHNDPGLRALTTGDQTNDTKRQAVTAIVARRLGGQKAVDRMRRKAADRDASELHRMVSQPKSRPKPPARKRWVSPAEFSELLARQPRPAWEPVNAVLS